jgi:hypothetical protein
LEKGRLTNVGHRSTMKFLNVKGWREAQAVGWKARPAGPVCGRVVAGVVAGRRVTLVEQARKPGDRKPWAGMSVTALEADIAYFEARLELLGEPSTSNQKAQVDTFRFLIQSLTRLLSKLKRRHPLAR